MSVCPVHAPGSAPDFGVCWRVLPDSLNRGFVHIIEVNQQLTTLPHVPRRRCGPAVEHGFSRRGRLKAFITAWVGAPMISWLQRLLAMGSAGGRSVVARAFLSRGGAYIARSWIGAVGGDLAPGWRSEALVPDSLSGQPGAWAGQTC